MDLVAPNVYRLGSKWVNFYVVEAGGALTIVDTGLPGYRAQLPAALDELGRGPSDVKAIVLTHTHTDHIGLAPDFRALTGAPVFVHEGEASIATGHSKPTSPKGVMGSIWRGHMLSFVGHFAKNKGTSHVTVSEVSGYRGDEVLDVPGKLRVVHSPGHSGAHCGFLLEDRKVFFSGDALATLAVDTGATGPMVHPFNEDRAGAIRSLDILEHVDAELLLPGHGDPWQGSISDAVSEARRRL